MNVSSDLIELSRRIFTDNREAGWWDVPDWYQPGPEGQERVDAWIKQRTPTCLLLIHAEVSEATEGHRKGAMDDHLPHRTNFEVELADALIRILDLARAHDIDMDTVVAEKLAYNRQRADHKRENRSKEGGKQY